MRRTLEFALRLLLLIVASSAVHAEVGASALGVTTRSGDCYVLIGSPTAGSVVPYEGVFRFRRGSIGDDATYARVKLGQAGSGTPAFPVRDAYGLSADKFSRVYLLQNNGDAAYRSIDWSKAPVSNINAKGQVFNQIGSYGLGTSLQDEAAHDYNLGKIYVIHKDGSEEFMPSVYARATVRSTERVFVKGWYDGEGGTPDDAAPGNGVNGAWRTRAWDRFPYVGPADGSDLVLPPPVGAYPPWAKSNAHGGCTNNKGWYLFPTSGDRVAIPFGEFWLTRDEAAYYTGRSHGWLARKLESLQFKVARMFLQKYLDTPDAAALQLSSGLSQDGDALFQSVGTLISYFQQNSCGDGCINVSTNMTTENPPSRAKVAFSTYGELLSQQRMYSIRIIDGRSELLKLTNQGGRWVTQVISPSAANVINFAGPTNFQSVGVSPRSITDEWIYLSTKPADQFTVSGSFYQTGGIVWELDPAAGTVRWQERNEQTGGAVSGTIAVGGNVTNIAADGMGNVYYLATRKEPVDGEINSGADPMAKNVNTVNPIDVEKSPYFDRVNASTGSAWRTVRFRQFVGKSVNKAGQYGGVIRNIGFAPKGERYWERKQRKMNGTTPVPESNPGAWTGAAVAWDGGYTVASSDVDATVRSEIAAPNTALPPATGENRLDIAHIHTDGAAWTAPQNGKAFEMDEDTGTDDHFFSMENPPILNGLFRVDIGSSNTNFSPSDFDGDGDTGKYVAGIIWVPDLPGVTGIDQTRRFRYRWEVVNVTHRAEKPVPFTYKDGWTPAASLINSSDGWINAEMDGTKKVIVRSIKLPRLIDPGKYEVRLRVKGAYWDTQFADFNSPVSLKPTDFALDSTQTVTVQAAGPRAGNYVYDMQMLGVTESGGPIPYGRMVEANNPGASWPKIWCEGLVQFYQGRNYQTSGAIMEKTSGAGQWDYLWDYASSLPGGQQHPPNFPPATTPDIRNDGDGPWGTQCDYSLDPASFDNNAQQLHDWQAIKYQFSMKWLDKAAAEREMIFQQGNLSELVVLERNGAARTALTAGRAFLETVSAPARRYRFRVPIYFPQATNLLKVPTDGTIASNEYGLWPNLAGSFQPALWYVPTDPTSLEFTCRIFYPKVKWVPAKKLVPGSSPPRYDVLRDASGDVLYYHLEEAQGPVDLGDQGKLWPGEYNRTSGTPPTAPAFSRSPPGSNDGDDYFELVVTDNTRPRVLANPTGGLDFASPSVPTTSTEIAGKAASVDLKLVAIDNNPYAHFSDYKTPDAGSITPQLSLFCYQAGLDPRVRDATGGAGMGLRGVGRHFGFDISRSNTGFTELKEKDYMGESGTNSLPQPGDYLYPVIQLADLVKRPGVDNPGANLTGTPAFPQPSGTPDSSIPLATAGANRYAFNRQVDQKLAFRTVPYEQPATRMALPIFLTQTLAELKVYGAAKDKSGLDSDAESGMADNQADTVALYKAEDRTAPNILVELLDFRGGQPVYWAANGDLARSFSPYDSADYMQVKKSLDPRDVTQRPAYTGEGQFFYAADRIAATSSAVDFSTGGFVTAFPGNRNVLLYRIEEDVRFQLKVSACDNVSQPERIKVEVAGGGSGTTDPLSADGAKRDDLDNKAVWMKAHYYPRSGDSDLIQIAASDESGNRRAVTLKIEVAPHGIDYRVIGNQGPRNTR